MVLTATGKDEHARAARRAQVKLTPDRTILQQTRNRRDTLLAAFESWLQEVAGPTVAQLVDDRSADPETLADWLVEYGKDMYYAGKPYGRYSETLNAIAARRPVFRKQIVKAWDLAYAWITDEPYAHHPAVPASILIAFTALARSHENRRGACSQTKRPHLAKGWCPRVRFCAFADQIRQPKTRGTGPKHQAARIDPADAIQLPSAVFGKLGQDELLWNRLASALTEEEVRHVAEGAWPANCSGPSNGALQPCVFAGRGGHTPPAQV